MSQLLVHEVWGRFTLDQIARMDDLQIWNVVFRRREENGQLVRGDDSGLPDYVRETIDAQGNRVVTGKAVSFKQMFSDVNKHIESDKQANIWREYQINQALAAAAMQRDLEEQTRLQYQVVEQLKALPPGAILFSNVAKYNK